jgi:hypothetical protein
MRYNSGRNGPALGRPDLRDDVMAKGPKVNPSTMLWFIRSRSYMPIHEIRRRFMIEDEDATVVYDQFGPVYMGLPPKPANVVIELSKQGKIGLECSVDFNARVLVGVFPMHPAREEGTLRPNGFERGPRPQPVQTAQPRLPENGTPPRHAQHGGPRRPHQPPGPRPAPRPVPARGVSTPPTPPVGPAADAED